MEDKSIRKRRIIVILIVAVFALCILGILIYKHFADDSIEHFLDTRLGEAYVIQDVTETGYDGEKIYTVYLPESNITVEVDYYKSHEEVLFNSDRYYYSITNYFDAKFDSLAADRRKLRSEKYPCITEFVEYSNGGKHIKDVMLLVPDLPEYSEDLYNYLVDVYQLNEFKLYNSFSKDKGTNDSIRIVLAAGDQEISFGCFSDLRKEIASNTSELISYDEFRARIEAAME